MLINNLPRILAYLLHMLYYEYANSRWIRLGFRMGVGVNQEFLCPWGQLIFFSFSGFLLCFQDLSLLPQLLILLLAQFFY